MLRLVKLLGTPTVTINTATDTYAEMAEPAAPAAGKCITYLTSSGVSPNKEMQFCVKFEDGTVFVLASTLV